MTSRVSAKNKKLYEEIIHSYCDVCFTYFRKVPPKKINEGLDILLCTKCHCKTHKCCYDLAAQSTPVTDKISQFVCDRCATQSSTSKQCLVCQQSDGALISTPDNQWIHVFCALYHNQIDIVWYTPKIKVQKSISYTQTAEICEICKKSNAFESCALQTCKRNAHPYCVKKLYTKEEMENEEPKCWNHHLTCGDSNVFDLGDEIMPFSLVQDTIQEELLEVEQNAPFQIPNKQSIIKAIYEEYYGQARKRKEKSKKLKRGGFSYISCTEHEFTPYCSCQGAGQGNEMIQCETCLTWYHMDCEGYKPTGSQQVFSCKSCKSFYQLKKKIVDEVIAGKNESYELKCEFPPKISFMDLMWIMRAIDSRIAKGNVSKMLKELPKYPLRTSKMEKLIKIQNKNQLEVLSEDFFHQFFFSDEQFKYFKPLPVLGLDIANKPIKLDQNIQKNKELKIFITTLRNFCKKQGIVDEFKGIQRQLDFKEEALSDSYEKIIELSKSQQKYQEVAILKIKAQAYSFLQIVKKVNSGTIITINQLQQSVQKASLIENVPEYLTRPLTEKHQKVKKIIENLKILIQTDPNNLIEIKNLANKLTTDFKIQPPLFYDLYLEERNFINTLYFYYVKMSQGKIEGELSLKQKISQLLTITASEAFSINEELTKNLNFFLDLRLKAGNPNFAFNELKTIVENLQKKTIKQTFRSFQTNNIFRRQKLEYLFERFVYYQIDDPFISGLIQRYRQIQKNLTQIIDKPLQNVISPNALRLLEDYCAALIKELQDYPLKVQQQIKKNKVSSWVQMARVKRQQISQLLTLSQQAQMQKNPLTLNKLLQTLPKQNPLVKSFRQLKKEQQQLHNQFVTLMAICSDKMEFFKSEGLKKTRKEQIQINQKKPDLKRFNDLLQILNHSKVDFSKEIRDITRIINKSLDTSYLVEKFCRSKQNFQKVNSSDELGSARKQIDELRKKILINTEIALTKQLSSLYHSQIHNRIRTNFIAGNFDLDKNSKLLKFAEEQGIANTPTYFKLKEKFETKNQKSKEINLIKNIETRLKTEASKQTDPIFKNLYASRKLLHIPDVDQQTPKISYIQELKQKNKEIKTKISKILTLGLNPETKASLDEAKALLFEALKSPFNLSNLGQFYSQVERCNSFYTNWKRSNSLGRNTLYNDQKLKQYEKLKFRVEELQNASKQIYKLKGSLRILQTIENIQDQSIQTTQSQNFEENFSLIEENIETIEQNQLAGEDNQMILLAKKKYLKIWITYLKHLQKIYPSFQAAPSQNINLKQHNIVVNIKKIKKLLYDSYFLLQYELKSPSNIIFSDEAIKDLKQGITFLEKLFIQIKFNYLEGQFNKSTNIMNSWIDIDDFVYEIKVGASLDELFFIYKPFDDLNKFKYRNLAARNTDLLLTSRQPTKEESGKRPRPEQFNLEMKEEKPLLKKQSSQVPKNEQESDSQQKRNPNVVTASSRKKIKQIFSKNILKNSQLKKVGTWQNEVKMIQNQIFGEYNDDVVKYFQMSEKFEKLFIKLQQCPEISKKLIKKEFQFKFIKLLVENLNTITDIQTLMANKLKQQKNAQKFTTTLQTTSLQATSKNKIEEEQNNNVLDMLATGNVNEAYKRDLENEMKKIKEGKEKKKKRSKHRHRSRSRTPSPEAKFSSESEQQNLPSYIQKQYAQEDSKTPFESRFDMETIPPFPRNDPLMFDPEVNEQQMEDLEKKYPRGSTLRIKTTNLEFFLKKRGKMDTKINLYTQEDYRKITSELVDPGFSTLNIRKQKNDKEILDYLNKPSRKKYKFLICWMEAENTKQNQFLKELSQQGNERHKIYGWQNENIKIHVMSIKQFVQLTRFSSSIPNRTVFKQCVEMFNDQRIICVIQYPAEKMYELKQKFKNFADIEKVEETYQLNIPLPSYDTYEPIQTENPYYPAMGDVQNPNIHSIKPLLFDEGSVKQSKPVQFQGWGSSSFETQAPTVNQTESNPYEQTRIRLGFGRFSPIMSDEEDNVPTVKESLPDLADSLLKSFEQKGKYEIPVVETFKNQRTFLPESFQRIPYGNMKYSRPPYGQSKFYDGMGGNNAMAPGMNPIRGYNNPMGYQNRNFNPQINQGYNQMNRYQNQGPEYRSHSYQNYHVNRNMPYNQRQSRNPMFNPMNPIQNPMNAPMSNPMNNPMGLGQQNQYQQANPRYPPYQQHGNNPKGYQQ